MWYHGISTHGRVAHVAIFLKQAKACRVMCHAGLCVWCAKPQKVENRLHGGADKCQLRHTHDGPRQVSNQDIGFSVLTVSSVAALYLWTT